MNPNQPFIKIEWNLNKKWVDLMKIDPMKYSLFVLLFISTFILISCNTNPSSPGGKLGSKNYSGNYTMGVTSGSAYVYLSSTGDTLVDLRYSLDSAPSITIHNVVLKENGSDYSLTKVDGIGSLTGATTSDFGILTFQYVTGGNTLGFTGNKIQ